MVLMKYVVRNNCHKHSTIAARASEHTHRSLYEHLVGAAAGSGVLQQASEGPTPWWGFCFTEDTRYVEDMTKFTENQQEIRGTLEDCSSALADRSAVHTSDLVRWAFEGF